MILKSFFLKENIILNHLNNAKETRFPQHQTNWKLNLMVF